MTKSWADDHYELRRFTRGKPITMISNFLYVKKKDKMKE